MVAAATALPFTLEGLTRGEVRDLSLIAVPFSDCYDTKARRALHGSDHSLGSFPCAQNTAYTCSIRPLTGDISGRLEVVPAFFWRVEFADFCDGIEHIFIRISLVILLRKFYVRIPLVLGRITRRWLLCLPALTQTRPEFFTTIDGFRTMLNGGYKRYDIDA